RNWRSGDIGCRGLELIRSTVSSPTRALRPLLISSEDAHGFLSITLSSVPGKQKAALNVQRLMTALTGCYAVNYRIHTLSGLCKRGFNQSLYTYHVQLSSITWCAPQFI